MVRPVQLPLDRAEPADEEEHDADADEGERRTEPDLLRQRLHEGKHVRLLVLGLLEHDADAQTHEGLREVQDLLSVRRYGQWGDGYVGIL